MPADTDGPSARLARLFRHLDTPRPATGIDSATRRKAEAAFEGRRTREVLFGADAELFGEPAWDILLDLFLAQAAGGGRTLAQLCARVALSPASARRWVNTLTDRQLLVHRSDRGDPAEAQIALSSTAIRQIAASLK